MTFEAARYAQVTATADGYVLVSRDSGRYQIDSVGKDGDRRWSKTAKDTVHTGVQVGRNVVVVAQDNQARKEWPGSLVIHVYDARTGGLLWSDDQPSFVSVDTAAVYTSVCHGGQNNHIGDCRLSARDPRTGDRRWSIATYASAGILIPYRSGSLAPPPAPPYLVIVSYPTGYASQTLTTVDPRSGRRLGTSVRTIAHVVTDRVLVSADLERNDPLLDCTKVLTGWNPRGGRLWHTTVTGTLSISGYCPHLDTTGDGHLAVLTTTGTTALLSLTTGKTTWTATAPGEPVLVGRGFVITANGDGLACHDRATHAVRWRTPGPQTSAVAVHGWLAVYDADAYPDQATTHIIDPDTGSVVRTLPGKFRGGHDQVVITEAAGHLGERVSRYAVYRLPAAPR